MSDPPNSPPRMKRKWRPPISLILFLMLATVLALPLVGLFFFRVYENQLVRETESELIAQSVVLGAAFRRELEAGNPEDAALGAAVAPAGGDAEPFAPIVPKLDLAVDEILPRRPDARPASNPPDEAALAVGARVAPLIAETQRVTLAGFRLLDAHGVVIAGREETGLSLAHVEEVAQALRGAFASVMRLRVSKHDPPPLYSISRGTSVRVFVALPIVLRGHVAGVVYASRTPSNVVKSLYEERARLSIAALSIFALTLAVGFVFHRAITGPMRELVARTKSIAAGDRSAVRPLTHHGTAEFAQLSESFLDMADSLHKRSDFVATFAAHVSHELKSPLTAIQGAAELLRDDMDAPSMTTRDRRRFLDNIVSDASRMTAILRQLRELARAEDAPIGGESNLAMILPALRVEFSGLDIAVAGDVDCDIRMSAENLRIVLSHLADNSLRHGAGRLGIVARRDVDMLRVVVADDGAGVSANNRSQIFDAFFTTRRESGGTGMGLAIVRAMLVAHGGNIALRDSESGASFDLTIPIAH